MPESDIVEQHTELQQRVEREQKHWDWWQGVVGNVRFAERMKRYGDDIEAKKEDLVAAEKPDQFKKLQAEIVARRAIREEFSEQALQDPLREARKALGEFEAKNSLFLQGGKRERAADRRSASATG